MNPVSLSRFGVTLSHHIDLGPFVNGAMSRGLLRPIDQAAVPVLGDVTPLPLVADVPG